MSKGDFDVTDDETMEEGPPDFCELGQHSDEITVSDTGALVRKCNDCGREEAVQEDECIDKNNQWRPEHQPHFGVCVRCDAEVE